MVAAPAKPGVPKGQKEAQKLQDDMRRSERKLDGLRACRRLFVSHYAGPYYGTAPEGLNAGDSAIQRAPLQLLLSMADALVSNVAFDPAADVGTNVPQLQPFAGLVAAAVKHRLDEADAEVIGEQAILDSLFGMAIFKTGLAEAEEAYGWRADPGKLHIGLVDLDDWIPDMGARQWDQQTYLADRYRVPFEWAMDELFEGRERDMAERIFKAQAEHRRHTVRQVGAGEPPDPEEAYVEQLDLIEAWLPLTQRLVTLPGDHDVSVGFLRDRPWEGPEAGPYDVLGNHDVPGNLMPVSRVAAVYDLHLLLNELAMKQARQAERSKILMLYDAVAAEEASAIRRAGDGDMLPVNNVDRFKQIELGGASKDSYEAAAWFYDWYNRMGGNLDVLSGMQSRSPTLGQEQMLARTSGIVVGRLRRRAVRCWRAIIQKAAWYVWTDPESELYLQLDLGQGVKIPMRWDPEVREGDFLDYQFSVKAVAVSRDTPEQQYELLQQWLERTLFPLAQIGAAQGQFLDVAAAGQITGKLAGIEEADRVWKAGPPMMLPEMGGGARVDNSTTVNAGGARQKPGQGMLASKRDQLPTELL